jgi:hypothetical protein
MPTPPNINNYYVGKGSVFFTPLDGVERHLGNVPEFEFTPALEKLDHYSSMAGVRSKDRSATIEKSATLRIVMDEWSIENLQLALMGGEAAAGGEGGAGDMQFDLLSVDEIRGAIRFVGANSIGPKLTITLPSVSFTPSSGQSFISDEWGSLELTGDVLLTEGSFGTLALAEPA